MQPDSDRESLPVWDRIYAAQGRLWGGAPFPVHEMLPIGELPRHALILEIGCGSGRLLPLLMRSHHDCIALDFSGQACRLAGNAVNNPSVTVLLADATKIPLRSGTMDAVIACHVAGHLKAAGRSFLFGEAARVLREGRRFLFCDFSVEDFRAGKGSEIEEHTYLRGNGIITHYFSEEEIRCISDKLLVQEITTVRRTMRVRGREYPRAVITASFTRT